MEIRKIMSEPAVTCRAEDSLNTAAQLMWERDCGALPVVDDGGRAVGIVTDRDICMAAYTQGRALTDIRVAEAMSRSVFSCHADDSLEDAERLMKERQIRRVPVVDGDNRAIGMLSLNDLARCAARARQKSGMERELTQTLAAICEPRPRAAAPAQPQR